VDNVTTCTQEVNICALDVAVGMKFLSFYFRQGGYVVVVVCLFVCLFVGLLATLSKNFQTDLHELFREGWTWANEQMIKFWWRSGSQIRIRIHIATLVRRALAEMCTRPSRFYCFIAQTVQDSCRLLLIHVRDETR